MSSILQWGEQKVLELPGKELKSREKMIAEAIKQLKNQYPEWTDYAPHDPGITLLELFAQLQMEQQERIHAVVDENKPFYLDLLQFPPLPVRPAETEVIFATSAGTQVLPARCKIKAQDMIFETEDRLVILDNQLNFVLSESKKQHQILLQDSTIDWYRDWNIFGEQPEPGNALYLGFDNPFPKDIAIHMKWNFIEESAIKRNPIGEEDSFHPLVKLAWEYYGLEEGKKGWHRLEVVKDTTRDFLYSGFITLIHKGQQLPVEDNIFGSYSGYALRCLIVEGSYDLPPRVKRIYLNSVPILQKQTLVESRTFAREEIEDQQIELDSWLAYYGHKSLFVRHQKGWLEWQEGLQYITDYDKQQKICRIKLLKPLPVEAGAYDEALIKVVAWEKEVLRQRLTSSSAGWIHQHIHTELGNITDEDFSLMVAVEQTDGTLLWQDWHQVEKLQRATAEELCYELDGPSGTIIFGDNRRGSVPAKGKNNILITDCTLTRGSRGNIHSAQIEKIEEAQGDYEGIDVHHLVPATGGRDKESILQRESRMLKDLNTEYRAVGIEDYARIVTETPGLMIDTVKVLPLYRPGLKKYPEQKAENCVTVVIEPYSKTGQGKLSIAYKKNIYTHLEKYRPITTKIYVVEPLYVGLEIHGEIVIKANYSNARQEINQCIQKFISLTDKKEDCQVILNFGDLYGSIELLTCVSQVRHLGVEPVGYRISKTRTGDIAIPANSRFFVSKTDLTLVHSVQEW
ncbi:hypothetical protein F9B85_10335 [Heliorestis acidaminivorans]|uniref:Uncharacterized protein n=1 Tax=Heliorestis acidaminivorans TaxID=553427 RepID=A0A6I0EPQ5_9FIRM|nr:baseplate J/gp47 family protein [Heliorestis acidaminivorans]KAB2951947.1 hypothetical protein F9B85_10335 [Heliorestis acidaminivorans]